MVTLCLCAREVQGPDVVIWPRGMPQLVGTVLLCQSQLSWPQKKVLEQLAPLGPVSEYNLKWFLVTHCGAVSTLLALPVVSLSLGKGRKHVCSPCKERQGRQSFAHDMLRECQQTGPGLQDRLRAGLSPAPGCVSVSLYLYSLTKSAGWTCSLRGPLEGSSARLDCITSASLPCSECCSLLRSSFQCQLPWQAKVMHPEDLDTAGILNREPGTRRAWFHGQGATAAEAEGNKPVFWN